MLRINSLAFRLFATSAGWTLLVLPLAGYMIYRLYSEDVRNTFDADLEKLVNVFETDTLTAGGAEPVTPINRYHPLFEVTHSGWYWQVKPLDDPAAKRLVSQSLATGALASPLEAGAKEDAAGQRWMNSTGPAGEQIRIVEVIGAIRRPAGDARYSVTVAGPIEWLDDRLSTFLTKLSIALTLAGTGLVAMTLFQVRFGLLPLKQIERGLSAIRSGQASDLGGELPVEIEPLQQELNALIQSNQDIVDRARTQVGNLAHALKTPLAVITNEARDDSSTFAAKVAEQASLMRDQINHYLDRARVAARVGIGRSTEVRPIIEPLVRALERINREREISISFECPDDARFQGEKHDLEEMLGNLLDNACKWARRDVYLTVKAPPRDARGTGRRLQVAVEDDGQGLSEEQRKRIGKRGLRLDETKPGSGLGLSIVGDLAQSYRGTMELDQSRRGGLLVRLDLPAV
ncbi:MAG: sensor histidine kinase [Hyphomicrobium sp.]